MNKRWVEILEGEDKRISSTRVTMLFGAWVGAIVILALVILLFMITSRGINTQTEYTAVANTAALTQILSTLSTVIGLFFMLCAGVYGMAKFSDNSVTKTNIMAANPPPPPPPSTTILPDAKNVNLKADGDINVNPTPPAATAPHGDGLD